MKTRKKQINKHHYQQKGYDSKQNTANSEAITLNQITADVKKEVIQEKHETKTDKNTEYDNILEMMRELHRKWKVPAEYSSLSVRLSSLLFSAGFRKHL